MYIITVTANLIALVVFTWLIYKAALPATATLSRCRLLSLLTIELKDFSVHLGARLDQLDKRIRKGKIKDVSVAINGIFDKLDKNSESGLPEQYQPAWVVHRIVIAKTIGDHELAWDELSHWHRRVSFNWSHYLHLAAQATKLGLLFTVVGVLLAFAVISQVR